jgi:hypothetical protein
MTETPIDVDAIIASLDPALADPGDNPWGGANLERCGEYPACSGTEAVREREVTR